MPYNFVPDSFYTAVTAEALRAKIGRKSAISHQRGHFDQKFQVQGVHACDRQTDGQNFHHNTASALHAAQ